MSENENNINKQLIFNCPHCNEYIIIEKLNCCIFRHGIFQKNGHQIDPHSSKNLCDLYRKKNLIYGCGKPFKIILKEKKYIAEIRDYI